MRRVNVVITGLMLSMVPLSVASQESERQISWGLLGGAFPVGVSNGFERGRELALISEIASPQALRAVRFEATYIRFDYPRGIVIDSFGEPSGEVTGNLRLQGVSANLVLRQDRAAAVSSHVILGAGVFRSRSDFEPPAPFRRFATPAKLSLGVNAGLGLSLSFSRVAVVAEGRYRTVINTFEDPDHRDLRVIPITVAVLVR